MSSFLPLITCNKIFPIIADFQIVRSSSRSRFKPPRDFPFLVSTSTISSEPLLATYTNFFVGWGSTSIWNLKKGIETAKIQNSRKVSHGVTISPDSRYAFVSVEGIGGEPGSVDIINLENQNQVSIIEDGKQAGGIIYWKTTDS